MAAGRRCVLSYSPVSLHGSPSISVHVVTPATTLTAFRDAAPAADLVLPASEPRSESRCGAPRDFSFRIHSDLSAVEAEWRRFKAIADCTVFQTYDWLAAWHRHIGFRARASASGADMVATNLGVVPRLPTITCSPAIAKTAPSRTSGRARCTCGNFSNTRSTAACSVSTSPSATSANGATAI